MSVTSKRTTDGPGQPNRRSKSEESIQGGGEKEELPYHHSAYLLSDFTDAADPGLKGCYEDRCGSLIIMMS